MKNQVTKEEEIMLDKFIYEMETETLKEKTQKLGLMLKSLQRCVTKPELVDTIPQEYIKDALKRKKCELKILIKVLQQKIQSSKTQNSEESPNAEDEIKAEIGKKLENCRDVKSKLQTLINLIKTVSANCEEFPNYISQKDLVLKLLRKEEVITGNELKKILKANKNISYIYLEALDHSSIRNNLKNIVYCSILNPSTNTIDIYATSNPVNLTYNDLNSILSRTDFVCPIENFITETIIEKRDIKSTLNMHKYIQAVCNEFRSLGFDHANLHSLDLLKHALNGSSSGFICTNHKDTLVSLSEQLGLFVAPGQILVLDSRLNYDSKTIKEVNKEYEETLFN